MSAKGLVYKRGGTWFYEVHDSEPKCVFADNTNNWRVIFDSCLRHVYVARDVERTGHRFKFSYRELVDKAAGCG